MQPPIIGTWQFRIAASRGFTIHSDAYYEITGHRTDSREDHPPIVLRIPLHACAVEPVKGQEVEITFLMGQVTKVR